MNHNNRNPFDVGMENFFECRPLISLMISQQVYESSSRTGRLSLHQSVASGSWRNQPEDRYLLRRERLSIAAHSGGRGRQSAALVLTRNSISDRGFDLDGTKMAPSCRRPPKWVICLQKTRVFPRFLEPPVGFEPTTC